MKKILGLAPALVLCGLTSVSQANDFSYSHIQGEYYAYDEMEIESGISLSGAVALNDTFHLTGGYQDAEMEDFFGSVDVTKIKAGIGVHKSVAHGTDLVMEGALLNVEAKAGGFSVSDSGYDRHSAPEFRIWLFIN